MLQTVQCRWRGAVGTAGRVWIDGVWDDKIADVSKQARGLTELASVPGRVRFTAEFVRYGYGRSGTSRRSSSRPIPMSQCSWLTQLCQ
jgi:hypothetical protein